MKKKNTEHKANAQRNKYSHLIWNVHVQCTDISQFGSLFGFKNNLLAIHILSIIL